MPRPVSTIPPVNAAPMPPLHRPRSNAPSQSPLALRDLANLPTFIQTHATREHRARARQLTILSQTPEAKRRGITLTLP